MTGRGVTTHELRPGDLVVHYGMRLRVPAEGLHPTFHPDGPYGPTLAARCVVENAAEVLARGDVAATMLRISHLDDEPGGAYYWTVQGNGLARWWVELEGVRS